MTWSLPEHLRKYVVEQNYPKYTAIDQACWRYILRQLRSFLKTHAHPCYLEGLEKAGISTEEIPRIEHISFCLEKFGWRALPVSGFIPPAAFMELQSLGVLPIASDMRSLQHIMYTPAPDIVHEAAGHAPILIHPEFSAYLKRYAQVSKKAIISKEDLNIYEAIRKLSDIKENPASTPQDVDQAQRELETALRSVTHISEASLLSRMNWWTAEYGLIGDLDSPKIYGAGLLSSAGESRSCLQPNVKKIPLTVDCIEQSYDITEPQPQLFVTPNFEHLSKVLEELENKMAFKVGGITGVQRAIQAQSVNTVMLNSGVQISGQCKEMLKDAQGEIAYLQFQGPCQISHQNVQLPGHGPQYHSQGYGTALGYLKNSLQKSLFSMTEMELQSFGICLQKACLLEMNNGVTIKGQLLKITKQGQNNLLFTFSNCTVQWGERLLFDPTWGNYDLALGEQVTSVFGGPADRTQYSEIEDFIAARVPTPSYGPLDLERQGLYQNVRDLRTQKNSTQDFEKKLRVLIERQQSEFKDEWLLLLECLELAQTQIADSSLALQLEEVLISYAKQHPETQTMIQDGLSLANQL